uniref:GIY-YIG domain-containing protein n=1 Tax=viral metagenome TaxID=1070528 RepID=A0A6C0AQY4_9ZZZZ
MGVYVYKSKHIDAIKVGHYSNNNAWSRIAHRGFYSCKRPDDIKDKVSVEDLDLLCWYPNLSPKDEKSLHKDLKEFRLCGEWFRSEAIDKLIEIITEENKVYECSKEEALKTKRRL